MQWGQNTQFSEQQEEEDKREEFWTELTMAGEDELLSMGSKLEVELTAPEDQTKYTGDEGGE